MLAKGRGGWAVSLRRMMIRNLLRTRHNTGLRGISAKRQLLKLFMLASSFYQLKG